MTVALNCLMIGEMGRGGLVSRVTKSLSVEMSWVRIPPARFRILGMVDPKRMAVGVKPKEEGGILA